MSYTNGGQTIDKSMNGLIVFDTGGGVTIEGDSITADGTITCNDLNVSGLGTFTNLPTSPATTSDTLFQLINRTIANIFYARLASPNIFTSTNSFNNFLPTSIITDTSDLFAFINRTIANVYYAQLGTANTFLGLNTFNTILPSSTLAVTTSNNELINKNIGNVVYSQLGTTNTFTSLNTFQGGIDVTGTTANIRPTGTLNLGDTAVTTAINMGNQVNTVTNNIFGQTINLGDDVNATINLLSRTVNMGDVFGGTTTIKSPNINLGSGSFGGTVTVGLDNASHNTNIISRAITVGTTRAGTTTSIVSPSVSVTGSATFNTTLPSSTIGVTTSDNELINKTIGNAHYSRLASPNAFSSTNSFDNFLPTSSITTTANNTAFINKNIGNTVYPQLTGTNTISANNTFSGLNTFNTNLPTSSISTTADDSALINKNIGNATYSRLGSANTYTAQNDFNGVVVVKNPQTVADATSAFSIQNSATNLNSINFGPQLAGGNYNPAMVAGDSGIFAGKNISGTYGTAVLNLTAHSNNKASVRIDGLGTVNIEALTNNLNADTTNITGVLKLNKITPLYTTVPAYTSADVGFIHTFSATNGAVINGTVATYITTTTIPKGVYTFFVRGSVATTSTTIIRNNVALKVTTGAVLLIQDATESTNLYSVQAEYSIPFINPTDQTFILTANRTVGTVNSTFVNSGERLTYIKILRVG